MRGRRHEQPGDRAIAACHHGIAPEDGPVVGAADHGRDRARLVHRLLDVGGLPERALLRAALSVAILFTMLIPFVPASELRLRPAGHPSADHRTALAGVPDPRRAGVVPVDLLLLPQGVLPLVLADAARLRGPRFEARL